MKKNGELAKQTVGEVYSTMMTAALQSSVQFLVTSKSEYIKNLQVKAQLLATLIDASVKQSELLTSQFRTQGEEFNVKYMLPKQIEAIEETIEKEHAEHSINTYNVTDILPTQKAKLVAETALATAQATNVSKDTDIKSYNLTDIMPQDKALKTAQTTTQTNQASKLVSDKSLVDKDIAIKAYYSANIQPEEKALATAKALIERGSSGELGGNNVGSLKALQLSKQTELYERQRQMYDEKKYLEIFKAQVNYQTLIFSDLGATSAVTPLTTIEMKSIYNAIAPTVPSTVPTAT
jgi:hypothetical protein